MWIPTKFCHKDVVVHLKMITKKGGGEVGPVEVVGRILEVTADNTFVLQVTAPDGSDGQDVLLLRENIHDIAIPSSIIVSDKHPKIIS